MNPTTSKGSFLKLTAPGLADYMLSNESKRRRILQNYKYPDETEPRVKILYYREARDKILEYHREKKNQCWLECEAAKLLNLSANENNLRRKSRLKNNARSLCSYANHYTPNSIELLSRMRQSIVLHGVKISITPEIYGLLNNKETLIKLDFGENPHPSPYSQIICQLFYKALTDGGRILPFSSCLVRQIETNTDFKKAGPRKRIMTDISAACQNIEAIWQFL